MLKYHISPNISAFSTNKTDAIDFHVILPLHQAHSALVRRLPQEQDDITGVDALITNERGLRIGVKTADCVPILLYDEKQEAVAAIHSGWKGTVQNIIEATINRMKEEFHSDASNVRAVIGPCIHVDAFEVGDEVYEKFTEMDILQKYGVPSKRMPIMSKTNERHPEEPCTKSVANSTLETKWHIDLPEICRIELLEAGVCADKIEVRPECTWTHHDLFFSARRLGKNFDRQRIINTIMLE